MAGKKAKPGIKIKVSSAVKYNYRRGEEGWVLVGEGISHYNILISEFIEWVTVVGRS